MVLKSRREERVSFEGAGRNVRQLRALSWGPQPWTLITCLVQPGCCNRDAKLGGAAKRRGSRVPVVAEKRRRKSSTGTLHALTSEAIYGFGRTTSRLPEQIPLPRRHLIPSNPARRPNRFDLTPRHEREQVGRLLAGCRPLEQLQPRSAVGQFPHVVEDH